MNFSDIFATTLKASGESTITDVNESAPAADEAGDESSEAGETVVDESVENIETETDEPVILSKTDNKEVEAPTKVGNTEEIVVGNEKVTIDYKDRESIKKYVESAVALKGIQAEAERLRFQLSNQTKTLEEHKKVKENWDTIESLNSKEGVEGVLEYIYGEGFVTKYREQLIKKHELMSSASPEERAFHERQEALEKKERAALHREAEYKASQERAAKEQEQVFQQKFEAMAHPAFHAHSFSGKLGNPEAEGLLNESLWSKTMAMLEDKVNAGEQLSPSIVSDTFKQVAGKFSGVVKEAGTKEAKKVIEQKKEVASTKVAAAIQGKSGRQDTREESIAKSSSVSDMIRRRLGI